METNTITKDYDLATGNKIINNYMILKEIGRGVHGKVKLAQNLNTQQLVAIKIVDKKNRRRQMGYSLLRGGTLNNENIFEENEAKIKREISILKKCSHPNVVKLLEVIDVPESRKIYMALEYTEKGEIEWRNELDQPILSNIEARNLFRDIVNGLDYLHYLGIIHRDIKPANILLSHDGIAKISDFGVSYYNELLAANCQQVITEEALKKIDRELAETAGTPAFFAPELCCASNEVHPKSPRISKAIDVWALGVTLYCFVFGQCPFIAATEFELFDAIPVEPLKFPNVPIHNDLKDLLSRLLTKNPDERMTLEEVKDHTWVTEDIEDVEEWKSKTDPFQFFNIQQQAHIIHDDDSPSMMNRLRQSIRKLSISFGNKRSTNAKRPISLQPTTTKNNAMYRLSQPSFPNTITSIAPTVSLSTGHTLILNSGLKMSEDSIIEETTNRRLSTTTASNNGLSFGKFHGTMTPTQ